MTGQRQPWHATERARLQTIGKTPSFRDGKIAAGAWAVFEVFDSPNEAADYLDTAALRNF